MAATPETLALAALVALYFLLTAAALFLRVRRARRPQQQQDTPTASDPAAEEDPASGGGEEKQQPQRRRRRARRRRQQQQGEEDGERGGGGGDAAAPSAKAEPLLPRRPQFPVASVTGSLQRRINERYDDLARASEAECPTIEQVCRLETERDNLKKDAAIYNSLQERLQASAPYKLIKKLDAVEAEIPEISFEELLAQEKEDTAFWQRNGKMRSISSKVGK